jgi:hypothetical protein
MSYRTNRRTRRKFPVKESPLAIRGIIHEDGIEISAMVRTNNLEEAERLLTRKLGRRPTMIEIHHGEEYD